MHTFRSQGGKIFTTLILACLFLYLPIFINPSIFLNRGNDLEEFFWPIFYFTKSNILLSGQIPLWNNLFFSGTPLITDPQSGLFYLPNVLFLLFSIDSAFIISIFLHSLLGGIGMYLLSKRGFNFTNLAALFTGISYIFWPKIIGFIEAGHFGLIVSSAWIPFSILSAMKLGQSPSLKWSTLFAVSLAFIFFNHLIIFAFTFIGSILIFIYKIYPFKKYLRRSIHFFVFAILSTFGLSAITLFPQLTWIPTTTRSLLLQHPDVYPKWNSFFDFFLNLIFPWQQQINQINSEKWIFTGSLIMFLAIIGFLYIDKKLKIILILYSLILFLISLNNLSPIYPFLVNQDWYVLSRVSTRVFFIFQITMIILAGFAINQLSNKKILSKFFLIIIILTSSLELLLIDWTRLNTPINKIDQVPEEVYQYLSQDKQKFRVFCLTRCIPQKQAAIHNLELVEGYGTLQQKNYYDQFIQLSQVYWNEYTLSLPPFEIYKTRQLQPFTPELADYNVKYVISPYDLKDENLFLKKQVMNYFIYENTIVKSRAFFSDGSEARILNHSPNFIRVATNEHPTLEFTLSEVWSLGWKANLNGINNTIISEPKNKLRNVKINEDTKFVDFRYKPRSFIVGKLVTIITILVITFIWILKWKKIYKD